MHPQAEALVGPGIAAFEPAFIAGTRDPNRAGQQRLDFVIYHTDGGYWRIHPGSKPRSDALPKYFARERDASCEAAEQWTCIPPQGFSYMDALKVPQTDRLGRRAAWAALQNLPPGRLDSQQGAWFKWWLWLANLGPYTQQVLQNGVVALDLTSSDPAEKRLTCVRADGSSIDLILTPSSFWLDPVVF